MDRWSLYIDIQGFSKIYNSVPNLALNILTELTKGLYKIGINIFPDSPKSLFIHQIGDGFVILSDFPDKSLERPISIAIALMQLILLKGGILRAAISDGKFGDILSCYPKEIREKFDKNGVIQVGDGLMTIFPVMGDALISSHELERGKPKGPLLFVDAKL